MRLLVWLISRHKTRTMARFRPGNQRRPSPNRVNHLFNCFCRHVVRGITLSTAVPCVAASGMITFPQAKLAREEG